MKKFRGTANQNARASTFQNARILRDNMTSQEMKLWERLSKKQVLGQRFRRQHTIEKYVLDFFCLQCRLSIEVDGKHHLLPEEMEYDKIRTNYLNDLGIKELRFSNELVENDIDSVVNKIKEELEMRI